MAAKAPRARPRPAATAAPSAAGRRSSGSAGAASARPGARSARSAPSRSAPPPPWWSTAPPPCSECGWQAVKWVGRCGECQAWGSGHEVGAVTVRTTAAVGGRAPGRPDRRGRRPPGRVARRTGVREFDRVLGGGLVPGAVVLVAGEPGIGKSTLLLDVAARAAARRAASTGALRQRRGVRGPGAAAGRADRGDGPARSTSPPRPTWPPCSARSTQSEPDLVVVDSVQTIASGEVEGSAGNVSPGPRGRRVADPGGQGPRHRDAARRPRHQGRLDRRAAGARAPGRRRRAVRGRPALPAAAGPRGQEPLRPHRRGRLLRPVRRRHRRARRPQRAVPVRPRPPCPGHLRHGHPRGPAPAGHRGAGPGRAPSALATPRRATSGLDGAPGRDDPRGARPAGRRARAAAATSTSRPSAGCGSPSRPPTWRSALAHGQRRRPTGRCRTAPSRSARSAWPARSARSPASTAGWPRPPGSGFTRAVVPPGVARRRPDARTGMRVVEVADIRRAVRAA